MFTVLWVSWLAVFVVIEGVALFNKQPGDTLSDHVWRWFAVGSSNPNPNGWTRLRRFALLAFMVWLTLHFLTGGVF